MTIQNFVGLFSVTVLVAGMAQAAPKKVTTTTTKQSKVIAKASETTLKNVEGQVKWTGYGVGKTHSGTIDIKSGEVVLKNNEITSAMFVLDMTTLNTPDSEKLKGHLKSDDFFAVDKFKEATFKTTKVEALKNADPKATLTSYALTGDLTIKDKTAPITFTAIVTQDGKVYTATGNAEISDRTKYGIVYHSKQFETASKLGDKLIEDNIKVDIEAKAQ